MSDMRITASNAILRGLDTMMHKDNEAAQAAAESFADIFSRVVSDANLTDAAADSGVTDITIGDYDPDVVMLTSSKAEMALTLAVQVRDKVVDSYNEILRMQV